MEHEECPARQRLRSEGSPTSRNILVLVCFNMFVCAVFCAGAFGQLTTGNITGTVSDPSGAVVPGAQVTVTITDTGFRRTVATSAGGRYTMTLLQPGTYSISAEKQGFSKSTLTGIVLQVAQTATVNLALRVGPASISVEVAGDAPLLQSSTK